MKAEFRNGPKYKGYVPQKRDVYSKEELVMKIF